MKYDHFFIKSADSDLPPVPMATQKIIIELDKTRLQTFVYPIEMYSQKN